MVLAQYHRPVTVAFRSDDAALLRRNRWWLALGASPYVVALSLIVTALVTGVWQVAIPAFHMSLFGTLGLFWAYGANKSPVKLSGGISVGDAGVYHAGKLLAGRDELEAGFITPKPTGVTVRLQRRGRRPSLRSRSGISRRDARSSARSASTQRRPLPCSAPPRMSSPGRSRSSSWS